MRHRQITDDDLAGGAMRQDNAVFPEIIRRHYGRIYLTALSATGDADTAEDIAQETFIRAWLKIESLRDPALFLPWLNRIARNLSAMWLRTGQTRSRLLPLISTEELTVELPDKASPSPREQASNTEQNRHLSDAVMGLSEDLRQVVLLHYAEGMSASDIARMNGEAPSTVTRRLEKARGQLRAHMESGLAAGLAMMKPGARSLEKSLGILAAVAALPAASRAQILQMVSDTPPPPLIDAVTSAANAAQAQEAGNMFYSIIAKIGAAKLLTGIAAAAVIGGGTYVVKSQNEAAMQDGTLRTRETVRVAALNSNQASESSKREDSNFTARSSDHKKNSQPAYTTSKRLSPAAKQNTQTTGSVKVDDRSYDVSGTVFDKDTSEPIVGAHLKLLFGDKMKYESVSAEDGRFAFANVPYNSNVGIAVDWKGYVSAINPYLGVRNGVTVLGFNLPEKSGPVTRDLPMIPAVNVSGHMSDKSGAPVADAEIRWNGNLKFSATPPKVGSTDSAGNFSFQIHPFQEGMIEVSAEGYAFHRSNAIKISNENITSKSITLDPGAIVEGRVLDPSGEPVSGAIFEVTDGSYSLAGSNYLMQQRTLTETDSDGRFHLGSLPPGNSNLIISAQTFSPINKPFNLSPGEVLSGVEIRLVKKEMIVAGRVVSADGKPTTAHINIMNPKLPVQKTDEKGNFKIGGLSEGEVTLYVISHNPQLNKQVKLQVGTTDNVIIMDGSVLIHGLVVDKKTGKPITDMSLTGGEVFTNGEGPGGFRIFLQAGSSTYPTISAKGYVKKTFEALAPKDVTETTIKFEMGTGAELKGRVVFGQSGDPMAGITVAAYEDHPMTKAVVGNSTTDADGRFTISDLPYGKLKIKIVPEFPLTESSSKIELVDGEVTDMGDIKLVQGGSIHGKIFMGKSGNKPENINIFFRGPDILSRFEKLGADGTFNYPNLIPGNYTISANSLSRDVNLKPGDDAEVNMTLGHIKMTGTITVDGKTTESAIQIKNLATGLRSGSPQRKGKGYYFANLEPGLYEVSIANSMFDFDGDKPKILHTERFEIPDQPVVQKDFVVP